MSTLYTPVPTGRQNDSGVKNAIGRLNNEAAQRVSQRAAAWCHFNGTPASPHIDGGVNFRKIEKIATGQFRLWFEQSMRNNDYAVVASCGEQSPALLPVMAGCYLHRPDFFEIVTTRVTGAVLIDPDNVSVVVFGELTGEQPDAIRR